MFQFNPKVLWGLLVLSLICSCAPTPVWRSYAGKGKLETLQMQPNDRLAVQASECSLTLKGPFLEMDLQGDENFVKVESPIEELQLAGLNNKVECHGSPKKIRLSGKGQRVIVLEQPGAARPHVETEGSDHAVQFRPKP